MKYPFNVKIGIRLLILLLGLILIWKGEVTSLWFIIGIVYLLLSIFVLFILSKKFDSENKPSNE